MRFIIDLPLKTFIVLFIICSIIVMILHYLRYKQKKAKYSLFFKLSILLYILLLIKVAFLGIQITDEEGYKILLEYGLINNARFIQLIPFKTILDVLSTVETLSVTYIQIVGNIILLTPLSFILCYIKEFSARKTLLFTFFVSLFIESYQLIISLITKIPSHTFDIDDIILNIFGAVIVIVVSIFIKKNEKIKNFIVNFIYKDN